MKRFLLNVLFFSLPILIISLPLDIFISYLLKQSNEFPGEYEVMNDIYNGKANCDIAIYGSSRAWVQINPEVISDSLNLPAYNFGIDGHNFWLQYLRHLELLKHNPKPKVIILSLEIFSLEKRKDLYMQNQFLPYMLWNRNIKNYTSSYIGYKKLDYEIPLIRYFGKKSVFKTCISILLNKESDQKYRDKGFKGMDKQWNSDFDEAKDKMESYVVNLDTTTIALFEQFILECKSSNTELILCYTPEYIEGQAFVKNREDIINIFTNFAEKYHLLFLDYSNSSLCRNKDFFYNAIHLNNKGANIFSGILAHDIKNKLTIE